MLSSGRCDSRWHLMILHGVFLAVVFVLTDSANAHELRYTTEEVSTVVIRVNYPDGSGFSGQPFEVYREGETAPYQVGHTDAGGRIPFVPDGPGTWHVRAFSKDGHGLDVTMTTTEAGEVQVGRSLFERYARVITGMSIIFGLFGLLMLFVRRT